jgi:hypothetical protein
MLNRIKQHGDKLSNFEEIFNNIPTKEAARGLEQLMMDKA